MESLKRSMKAALMTPLVSSLALTWGEAFSRHIYLTASSFLLTQKKTTVIQLDISLGTIWTTRAASFSLCKPQEASPLTHIEIKERIHLVLNNGDRLEQLLCIHGPHHAIHSARTGGAEDREDGEKMEKQRWISSYFMIISHLSYLIQRTDSIILK